MRVDGHGSTKPNGVGNDKKSAVGADSEKHNALMDEFKKAHQKMFKNGFCETDSSSQLNIKVWIQLFLCFCHIWCQG